MATIASSSVVVTGVRTSAYKIPTDEPEADGTYQWDSTTLVLVELTDGEETGIGFSYADTATAQLIDEILAGAIIGRDIFDIPAAWTAMIRAIRNLGRPGIASMAISAVDAALWDLKAKWLGLPLSKLWGGARDCVPIYGSGGFTSYSLDRLSRQLGDWAEQGIPPVKMKVGSDPQDDLERVAAARQAIGDDVELFVDANGAYGRKEALEFADRFADFGVTWFEEPVSSDDLEGLRLVRDRAPPGMDVAAGEYGYDLHYFRRMLEAGAVDVLQADATRCAGLSGFLQVGPLCAARSLELSAHCAPSLHLHACCTVPALRHIEYFHDHARIERMLFDGAPQPMDGELCPDLARPGLGLEFKQADAEQYLVWRSDERGE